MSDLKNYKKNITNESYQDLIKHAIKRAGLKNEKFEPTKSNVQDFAEAFTAVICETLIITNNFGGEFKFQHLITREGTLSGKVVLVRGKGLSQVSIVDPCGKKTCNEDCDSSPQYEDQIPIIVLKVADKISEFCLDTVFCNNEGVQNYISLIRSDLNVAIRMFLTKRIEDDFNKPENWNENMTIYVEPDSKGDVTDEQITEAIREAQYTLTDLNNKNLRGVETSAAASDIYALLNYRTRAKYDKLYACCINANEVFGDWRSRVQSTSRITDEKVLGYVYDKKMYPVWFGKSKTKTVDCDLDECIRMWEQYAAGFINFRSGIKIVIGKKPTPQQDVDNDITKITAGSPYTSTLDYATISVLTGEQTSTALGITLPTNEFGTIRTLTFKSKDDDAKTITYTAKVSKTGATDKTTDIVINASDKFLLTWQNNSNELLELKKTILNLQNQVEKLKTLNKKNNKKNNSQKQNDKILESTDEVLESTDEVLDDKLNSINL